MIFAVKKQENKITEGLGKCLLEKKRWTIFTSHKRSRSDPTNTIPIRRISWWWKVEKNIFIRGMEKPKLLHSGTCTSTSTRHVTLKSPLLLQFPYCELCDNDNRQSNYRLMNVLFCTRALFPDFSKSSK